MAINKIDDIVFNEKELFRFLIDFDYIVEKYGAEKDTDEYLYYAERETREQLPDVVKRDYSSLYDNICLVYGNDEKAMRMMYIYKIVKEEIVNKFLNIEGLERIYDEHFFEFEWDMHSRLDFDNHSISFYRDHFVHQVRNLYEMWMFIEHDKKDVQENKKIHFYDNIRQWFDYGDNKVSSYVKLAVDKIVSSREAPDFLYSKPGVGPMELRDAYIKYIIKAAVAMCALFHDIGYPVLHFEGLRKRIAGFMPSLYMFTGGEGNNFEHIYSQLYNSFLFRIVGKEELREAVCGGVNHGAVSAIAFLLNFYQNGVIYNVPLEKKIAIEIAALAIYDHTIKYACIDDKKDVVAGYNRPVYQINPIAYLLRICDDIQEWERTYFEIKDIPELIKCPVCGNTFIRQKKDYFRGFIPSEYEYKCCCGKTSVLRCSDDYVRRKIIDIINCKEVKVKFYSCNELISKQYAYIYFDYDPTLLLRMCVTAPTFSKFRIKELTKLKKILMAQAFGGYDETIVDFTLTPNPFILKSVIIGKLVQMSRHEMRDAKSKLMKRKGTIAVKISQDDKAKMKRDVNILEEFYKVFTSVNFYIGPNEMLWDVQWDGIISQITVLRQHIIKIITKCYKLKTASCSKIVDARADSICFYLLLNRISELFRVINSDKYEKNGAYSHINTYNCCDFFENKLLEYAKTICGRHNFTNDMKTFISDAVFQYSKLFDDKNIYSERLNCNEYYTEFKTNPDVYEAVSHYCHSENAINKEGYPLNYYSDYDLFVKMYNACKLVKKINNYDDDSDVVGL